MTKRGQVWKCEVCGNIVEVLHEGADALVCCGKPMVLMDEKTEEEGLTEKHVPIIEGKTVTIGSVLHPATKEHHIEWIEATDSEGRAVKKFLENPEDSPVAKFPFEVVSARAYCNLHGLWKG